MNSVDDEAGMVFLDDLFTLDTNFANTEAKDVASIDDILAALAFPIMVSSRAPHDQIELEHDDRVCLVLEGVPNQQLFIGISDRAMFEQVVKRGVVVGRACAS